MITHDYFTWRGMVMQSSLQATTKLVLHTLGCHMNDAGESCFPSIERLCKETSLSNRAVILHLRLAEEAGFIEKSKHGFAGKKWARNEYKATFPHLKSEQNTAEGSDFNDNKAVTQSHHLDDEGSDFNDVKVVTQGHTNYPVNYPVVLSPNVDKTTPREPETKSEPDKPKMTPEGSLACRLIPLGIAVTSINPFLCQWVKDQISPEFIVECVGLARQQKPQPEKIAPKYLDTIIRSELKPKAPANDNSWMHSDLATDQKAAELCITARPGESYKDLRQRIKQAIDGGAAQQSQR